MGWTLNERLYRYDHVERRARSSRESRKRRDLHAKLGLDYIEPELREMTGEIEAAENQTNAEARKASGHSRRPPDAHHSLGRPQLDRRNAGEAAKALGYEYIALNFDHSKAVTVANGMDEKRTLAQIKKIRAAQERVPGMRLLAGIEVDILKNGSLDLAVMTCWLNST